MSLAETITTGMNNPECAFFVGQTLGNVTAGMLIVKITLIYFGVKLLDKIIFKGVPQLYKKLKK